MKKKIRGYLEAKHITTLQSTMDTIEEAILLNRCIIPKEEKDSEFAHDKVEINVEIKRVKKNKLSNRIF